MSDIGLPDSFARAVIALMIAVPILSFVLSFLVCVPRPHLQHKRTGGAELASQACSAASAIRAGLIVTVMSVVLKFSEEVPLRGGEFLTGDARIAARIRSRLGRRRSPLRPRLALVRTRHERRAFL